MVTARLTNTAAQDARDLARSPVANPYRDQLADPYVDAAVPDGVALYVPGRLHQVGIVRPQWAPMLYPVKRRASGAATTAGVLGLALGVIQATLGLLVIALVNAVNGLDTGDRSFYQGRDASYILMGVLDFGVAALLIGGGIALFGGRVGGRVALSAGGWAVLGFSSYWLAQDRVPWVIPAFMGVCAVVMLMACYQSSVTRWLGVLPPPQPE
jgi:hypothetical protein